VKVGAHMSIAGSIDLSVDRAKERSCDTFQIFTTNPRGWKSRKLRKEEIELFRDKLSSSGIVPVVSHMPYLPNLASPSKSAHKRSVRTLVAEIERCQVLGIPYLVTHLGSHMGKGLGIGHDRIVEAVNTALAAPGETVMILLENTAGTKNSTGTYFEEIEKILDRIEIPKRVGVCLDTSHAFAAGYELRNENSLDEVFKRFEDIVGTDRLRVIHLNDSKGGLGSHVDRHEHIGMGYIGEKGFKVILKHHLFQERPLILETPIDDRRNDYGNISKVRELAS
jgi:deoxyribonuclease-4